MFGNFFKKTKPKFWLVEQPGNTKVLLLPDKFRNNEIMNQVFTNEAKMKLNSLFERYNMGGYTYVVNEFGDGVTNHVFYSQFVNMGECFFAESNDLNSIPGDVREFEFFTALGL